MRPWLVAAAAVWAWTAFRLGLNPPGGFWRDDNGHHHAGDPVLRDTHWARYVAFYYLNAMAFDYDEFVAEFDQIAAYVRSQTAATV